MIADRIRMIQAVSGGGGGFDPSQLQNLFAVWDTNASATLWSSSTGGTNPSVSGDSVIRISSSGNTANDLTWGSALRFSLWSNDNLSFLSDHNSGFNSYGSATGSLFEDVTLFFVGSFVDNYSAFGTFFSTTHFAFGVNSGFYSLVIGTNVSGSTTTFRSNIPIDGKPHVFCAKIGCPANAAIDGTFQMWIDGVEVSLLAINTVGTRFYNLNGVVGGLSRNSDRVCEGIVYSRNLTSQEVSQVNNYLLTKWDKLLNNNNSLLLNMQGTAGGTTFVDESPNAFTVTPYGNASLVSDATFGTVASFDGSGDYLSIPSNAAFNFGTGDFTVEAWIKPTALQTGAVITTATPTDYQGVWFGVLSDGRIHYLASGGSTWLFASTTTATAQVNSWYHLAYTRTGSTFLVYINGTLAGTSSSAGALSNSNNLINIGGRTNYNQYFNGLIGPLRITKGFARYTANFTPPTGKFPTS